MMGFQTVFCSTLWCKASRSLLNFARLVLSGLVSACIRAVAARMFPVGSKKLDINLECAIRNSQSRSGAKKEVGKRLNVAYGFVEADMEVEARYTGCLLYTSDAADDLLCVDLGGRR